MNVSRLVSVIAFSVIIINGFAQSRDSLTIADSLMRAYRFEEALDILEDKYATETDSLRKIDIEERLICSQNGASLMDFVSIPEVISQVTLPKKDFFLYLPLSDRSWRFAPNSIVHSEREDYTSAFFYKEGSGSIFFTDKDESGSWNIYATEQINDSLWRFPHLLSEATVTIGNELYPMLSPDGKSLYFASNGLYGVGGYDLYVSSWDGQTGEWGVPENLGFPFSSPYNDIFYAISEDEKYSLLVSEREAPADSVTLYVMKYEPIPVKHSISDPDSIASIARLLPASEKIIKEEETEAPPTFDMGDYALTLREIRQLRDSIASHAMALNDLRSILEDVSVDSEKEDLLKEIAASEAKMNSLTEKIDAKNAELQKIEMNFLMNGVIIDPDKAMDDLENEEQKNDVLSFKATLHAPGDNPEIMVEEPVKKFDYSFMVLPTGQFAEDNRLPSGLIYQIQIFATASPAGVKHLKGLSPVFERNPSPGKYIYSVGLFSTYNEALSNLNTVKKRGFKSAFVTAFMNGKSIPTTQARKMEKSGELTSYQVCILPQDGELPEIAAGIIRDNGGKDIVKASSANGEVFVIGPFRTKIEAEKLAAELIAGGVGGVSVEEKE